MLNAECTTTSGGLCDCAKGYFNYGGVCRPVLPAGAACTTFGQCVVHAQCSTHSGGTCDCDAFFYQHNGSCNPVVAAGKPCFKKGAFGGFFKLNRSIFLLFPCLHKFLAFASAKVGTSWGNFGTGKSKQLVLAGFLVFINIPHGRILPCAKFVQSQLSWDMRPSSQISNKYIVNILSSLTP